MIHADLHSKNHIPEDVLTSNCLGLLGLLADSDRLDFFKAARNARQELLNLPDMPTSEAKLEFWPYLQGGGIPDAILTVTVPEALAFKVIIEVKNGAPQSGDQLANYWKAASRLFPNRFAVVYLTGHRVFPKPEVDESDGRAGPGAQIYWVGWVDLFVWARKQLMTSGARTPCELRILRMLDMYLSEKGYRVFVGWNPVAPIPMAEPYGRWYAAPTLPRVAAAYRRRYHADVVSTALRRYIRVYWGNPFTGSARPLYSP